MMKMQLLFLFIAYGTRNESIGEEDKNKSSTDLKRAFSENGRSMRVSASHAKTCSKTTRATMKIEPRYKNSPSLFGMAHVSTPQQPIQVIRKKRAQNFTQRTSSLSSKARLGKKKYVSPYNTQRMLPITSFLRIQKKKDKRDSEAS
jgi:hypothetical protein